MQKIEPAYVSFQQAKWLMEIGFDSDYCNHCYDKSGTLRRASVTNKWIKEDGGYHNTVNVFIAPEQWQVVEWLRVNHGVWVVAIPMLHNGVTLTYYPSIFEQGVGEDIEKYFNSPREAYSEAFNYIMQHILIA